MAAPHLSTGVHIAADTALTFTSYSDEDRIVVRLGEVGADVMVFLPRTEIDRLVAVLTRARESLNASPVKAAA